MIYGDNEREVWNIKEYQGLVAWSEASIELSRLTSAAAGRFSFNMVPFFRGIAAAIDDPDIRKINLRKSTQIGGTQLIVNAICAWADSDPGPVMLCMADEDTAIEICKYRIQPTIQRVPSLKKLINQNKFNESEIMLNNDFRLVVAWSSSIARTASRPIRYLIMDEITKPGYDRTGKEGDAIGRIVQRTETFDNKKIILLSTVTEEGDNMHQQEASSDEVFLYFVPCPHCGTMQPLFFRPTEYVDISGEKKESGYVSWPDLPDENEAALQACYICNACEQHISTAEKNSAVALGEWVPQRRTVTKQQDITFAISRLYSLFPGGKFDMLVKDFMVAKKTPQTLQTFINNALAEYWTETIKKTNENTILNAVDLGHEPRTVPDEATALVLTVDVQKRGFWYVLRAWAPDENSWLVEYGFIKTWEQLEELAFVRRWKHKDGDMPVWRIGIDTGGGKREGSESSADEVYLWIIKNRFKGGTIYPCKGSSNEMPTKCKLGAPIEKSKAGAIGLRLCLIDTNKCKDSFIWRLEQANKEGSIASYVHRETGKDYFEQIQAEEKRRDRKTGRDKWQQISKNNHLFDCEAMQVAIVDRVLGGGIAMLTTALVVSAPVNIKTAAAGAAHNPHKPDSQWQKQQNPWKAGSKW